MFIFQNWTKQIWLAYSLDWKSVCSISETPGISKNVTQLMHTGKLRWIISDRVWIHKGGFVYITLWAHCCHMGTAIKQPMPDWVKPSFEFLTSGHSDAQFWMSECPDVKNYKWQLNPVWHSMLYSYTHTATVGVKVLYSHSGAIDNQTLLLTAMSVLWHGDTRRQSYLDSHGFICCLYSIHW